MSEYKEESLVVGDVGGTRYVSVDNNDGTHRIICKLIDVPALLDKVKRIGLDNLLAVTRGNQTKTAEYLRVNRGTLRRDIDKKVDYVVIDGKVYKQIGNINNKALTAKERKLLAGGL